MNQVRPCIDTILCFVTNVQKETNQAVTYILLYVHNVNAVANF